jgi:bifunctional ADP-heptose synthase (sugar kinase/adenylyltransferase)
MFGKYIYGNSGKELNAETGEEVNQLKKLFEKHVSQVEMDKIILSDFARGKRISMRRLQMTSSGSRSPELVLDEPEEKQVHFHRGITRRGSTATSPNSPRKRVGGN